jgi:hypothetical protein
MPTALIASGATAAESAEFTLADGENVTLSLLLATNGPTAPGPWASVLMKSSSGSFAQVGVLTAADPVQVLEAQGTFKVYRPQTDVAFGVDRS